jgi:hypothetical protein
LTVFIPDETKSVAVAIPKFGIFKAEINNCNGIDLFKCKTLWHFDANFTPEEQEAMSSIDSLYKSDIEEIFFSHSLSIKVSPQWRRPKRSTQTLTAPESFPGQVLDLQNKNCPSIVKRLEHTGHVLGI